MQPPHPTPDTPPEPQECGLPSDDVSAAFCASVVQALYQPIVAIADRAPLALEVLARLDHPSLGTLFPSHFVPQIEDAGLAWQLTRAIVDTALAEQAAHFPALEAALSLNFPLEVLVRPGFSDWLEQRRIKYAMPARRLIIELTESQPVANLNQAKLQDLIAAMSQLRSLGYRLAIDDFGPDMPRRQLLFTLPFDLLKLDKAVVNDPAHRHVLEQAVQGSQRAGLGVVAEGIEDHATWTRMQGLGVEFAQGFLVSRPLPCAEVAPWLNSWRAQPAPQA